MPELPEVETIVRELAPHLCGRTITDIVLFWEGTIDRPAPESFKERVIGARIDALDRRGKFLRFSLHNGNTLLVHLRMTGKFVIRAAEESNDDPYARLRFRLDDGTWLLFVDTRKFGRFYLTEDPAVLLDKLGPEPLSPNFTGSDFAARLKGHRGEIKRLLLDQRFIAGLGNIYASEALWRAGIHPQRSADTLTHEEACRLHDAIVATLEESIGNGGTSLGDRQYVYPNGTLGQQQEQLAVYDREGDSCPRCGYPVTRIIQSQRSTYFCPVCQK